MELEKRVPAGMWVYFTDLTPPDGSIEITYAMATPVGVVLRMSDAMTFVPNCYLVDLPESYELRKS